MQVAVALADESASPPVGEQGGARGVLVSGPATQRREHASIGRIFDKRIHLGEILDRQCEDLVRRSKA